MPVDMCNIASVKASRGVQDRMLSLHIYKRRASRYRPTSKGQCEKPPIVGR